MLTTSPNMAAELSDKRTFLLFPTPIVYGKIADITLCDRVEKVSARCGHPAMVFHRPRERRRPT